VRGNKVGRVAPRPPPGAALAAVGRRFKTLDAPL